jgi:hypothetical protein
MCQKEGWTESLPTLIHVTPEELVPKQGIHSVYIYVFVSILLSMSLFYMNTMSIYTYMHLYKYICTSPPYPHTRHTRRTSTQTR